MEEIKPTEGRTDYTPPSKPSKPATTDSSLKSTKDVSPQFVSPRGSIDAESGVFVTEIRDTGTGKVAFQYPPQKVVAAYARSHETEQVQQEAPEQSNASGGKAESNPKVGPSTVADAVTDDTTGQGKE
jgi:hypothetical protein